MHKTSHISIHRYIEIHTYIHTHIHIHNINKKIQSNIYIYLFLLNKDKCSPTLQKPQLKKVTTNFQLNNIINSYIQENVTIAKLLVTPENSSHFV